mmetsp:Transcript_78618/g.218287  ORF Transcript_78618/g.218287 Transcript_78618/m.218287 type:complete len:245 (+) Transcript_78618:196-930(+)
MRPDVPSIRIEPILPRVLMKACARRLRSDGLQDVERVRHLRHCRVPTASGGKNCGGCRVQSRHEAAYDAQTLRPEWLKKRVPDSADKYAIDDCGRTLQSLHSAEIEYHCALGLTELRRQIEKSGDTLHHGAEALDVHVGAMEQLLGRTAILQNALLYEAGPRGRHDKVVVRWAFVVNNVFQINGGLPLQLREQGQVELPGPRKLPQGHLSGVAIVHKVGDDTDGGSLATEAEQYGTETQDTVQR